MGEILSNGGRTLSIDLGKRRIDLTDISGATFDEIGLSDDGYLGEPPGRAAELEALALGYELGVKAAVQEMEDAVGLSMDARTMVTLRDRACRIEKELLEGEV
jgi:hypothetical protein